MGLGLVSPRGTPISSDDLLIEHGALGPSVPLAVEWRDWLACWAPVLISHQDGWVHFLVDACDQLIQFTSETATRLSPSSSWPESFWRPGAGTACAAAHLPGPASWTTASTGSSVRSFARPTSWARWSGRVPSLCTTSPGLVRRWRGS